MFFFRASCFGFLVKGVCQLLLFLVPLALLQTSLLLTVTGNGEIIEGVKISFDYLLSEAGDKIQFTFDAPDYIEGNDFEEDFTSGIIQCQQQCLAR